MLILKAALLAEINNPNPMARLKKATPKPTGPPLERQGAKPESTMSHVRSVLLDDFLFYQMDHLKQQIQLRFQAMNKGKNKKEDSDEDDD